MSLPYIFINSHPIQYFAPLYSFCASNGLELEVWYCSDESIRGKKDQQFGVEVQWDIPLLKGYTYRFFRNYSWKPSIFKGFFGLINLGLASALFRKKRSVVVVFGWNFFSSVYAIISAKLAGHIVCLRGESPLNQELKKSTLNRRLKKVFLGFALFRLVDKFFYIGKANKQFYEYFGVPDSKLTFTPYSVDNERFQNEARRLVPIKKKNRQAVGLPEEAFTIVYSGKYIHKKRPLTLLQAYSHLKNSNIALIMIGEGELRTQMEQYIKTHQLKNIILTGFINQSEISFWYSLADVFVMCSGDGETWGLSVNEAMNFGLPVIVSDRVGCNEDLVKNAVNGYTFKLDDVNDLTEKLMKVKMHSIDERNKMRLASQAIINKYSYLNILHGLHQAPLQ